MRKRRPQPRIYWRVRQKRLLRNYRAAVERCAPILDQVDDLRAAKAAMPPDPLSADQIAALLKDAAEMARYIQTLTTP